MSICKSVLRALLVAAITLSAGIGAADVPTPQEECVQRNLAVCEFPSGVKSMQPGPCPAGSRTLKPQGHEDCGALVLSAPAVHVAPAQPAMTQSRGNDLAWIGGVERWLIPSLIYGGAGCALWWVVWRWRRPGRSKAAAPPSGALAWLISGSIGALAGWKAAAVAFRHAFDSYDNHDSAAPLLLSVPIWLGTFGVVSGAVCGLLLLVWRRLGMR